MYLVKYILSVIFLLLLEIVIQTDIKVVRTSSLGKATFGKEKHKCIYNLEAFHGSGI